MANAVTASGEEGDPTSRYQNPRYSGKGVPDRANNPKRKFTYSDTYRSGSLNYDRDLDSGISEYDMKKLDNILRQRPKKAGN
jgi:hypothetical protein